ncbi:MAG: TIGR04551 family protein [Proteobacteria bacterium]|nr:TIGR04551 family protein [Pseudomonadota bacterium]
MTKWSYWGPSCSTLVALLVALFALLVDPHSAGVSQAMAQLTPTPLPQQTGQPERKPEGVAEQAKEGVDQLPTTPVIPQSKSKRKRFELFELDGYYRFRTDWFKNFHLGFDDFDNDGNAIDGGTPFPRALACRSTVAAGDCSETLKSANTRLRIEPTINVDETTQVYLQVDLLDNLVLGSTPESLGRGSGRNDVPLSGLSGNQITLGDSIQVKRAWAEVETSLGQISFGRMPWHWGLGIYANAGGPDPFSDSYDLDSDFGDTVDRVMFRAQIPGTRIDAAIATDWSSTSPVANHDRLGLNRSQGQPWDLEDKDDTNQWVLMFSRFDKPKVFEQTLARGDWAVNYGGFFVYRTQGYDLAANDPNGDDDSGDVLVRRGLKTYTPDVWFKIGKGSLLLELEAVAEFGNIDDVSDVELRRYPAPANDTDVTDTVTDEVDVRRFGGVARLTYRALQNKLRLGFEVGYASGDQWDNEPAGATHVSNARPLAIGGDDTRLSNFLFDPDYGVDLILFRELLGTVTNATYVKPTLTYDATSNISFRATSVVSFANIPVATPGNSRMYGAEFNGDLGYHRAGFFIGISYGILFPLAAMNHPATGDDDVGPGYGFASSNTGDASNAQTIQTRLMLQF